MKLAIDDLKTVKQVQTEFNAMFPFLKIEFFSLPHEPGSGSDKKLMRESNRTLNECRIVHNNGSIEIVPSMTVTELEKRFQDMYGLSVQVFRRSGKVWLETINTDYWTLAEHNELGEFMVKQNSGVGQE